MSYVRIWVHLVFSTKKREQSMSKPVRLQIQKQIIDNCKEKGIFLQAINGSDDHLHCLISLGKEQSISKVAMLIKGGSSFWVNKNLITKERFEWQDDYFAVSVSESQVDRVKNYIKNQEQHHSKISYEQEAQEFMDKYKWGKVNL